MKELVVTEAQSRLMTSVLTDLAAQAEAEAVFLGDAGGNILACISPPGSEAVQTIAALAAGSFSATKELARMIGETSFSSIYHKGENSSIYIQTVAGAFLLLIIFGKGTAVGLVKLYVDKASQELEPFLHALDGQKASGHNKSKPFEIVDSEQIFSAPDHSKGISK
jgi:predicted regulator of Ras-like GTPase activity (Roadblock/LC7/MglB family)